MGLVLHQSMVRLSIRRKKVLLTLAAEQRGPGIHHNNFEEHGDDMDMHMDMDSSRSATLSRLSRGIILLGDSGTFMSRHGDGDEGDHIDESHDLEAHMLANDEDSEERSRREETPAPQAAPTEGDTLQPKTHVPSPTKEKTAAEATNVKADENAHVEG
jgi:hypothetical protein